MQSDALDYKARQLVYSELISKCSAPSVATAAAALGVCLMEMQASFQRLAAGRIIILQTNDEIMAANPFANVPTTFVVEAGQRRWSALCIWDALGIPAMLKADALISTACGDCNDRIELRVHNNELQNNEVVVHFAVPAKHWWDNIVFS